MLANISVKVCRKNFSRQYLLDIIFFLPKVLALYETGIPARVVHAWEGLMGRCCKVSVHTH